MRYLAKALIIKRFWSEAITFVLANLNHYSFVKNTAFCISGTLNLMPAEVMVQNWFINCKISACCVWFKVKIAYKEDYCYNC